MSVRHRTLVLLLGTLTVQTACGSDAGEPTGSGGGTDNLVLVSYGGAYQDSVREFMLQPFAEQEGINFQEDEGVNAAKIQAAVQAGNVPWDVVQVVAADYSVLRREGNLLEPIDYSLWDDQTMAGYTEGALRDQGATMGYWSLSICYRTDLGESDHPHTWAEFWDTKTFPGPRLLPRGDGLVTPWEAALLADGVSPDQLYPLDFDRAEESLDRIRDDVTVWWVDTAAAVQALIDGEVDYAMISNNRVMQAKAEGAPVDCDFNQQILSSDLWVVPRGAENSANAMEFIAYQAQADVQAALSEDQPTGPANVGAIPLLDPTYAATLPSSPENLETAVTIDDEFYASDAGDGKTWAEVGLEHWNAWFGSG